ncbi:MAG: hypothetical protein IT462_11935 [Planctomycetes bacterium]|nr:hypothetical protein [Planctomycetota bacterium]
MQPEARLRARCASFLTSHLVKPCWFTAIEHGRRHHGTVEQRAREWQHLAAQGVKQGIGDLLVLAPGFCCFIELKAGANKQSEAQHAFQAVMAALGHGYSVVRSVEQLGEALSERGIPLAPNWRLAAQHHDAALDGEPKPARKQSKPRAAKPTRSQVARGNRIALALARGAGE